MRNIFVTYYYILSVQDSGRHIQALNKYMLNEQTEQPRGTGVLTLLSGVDRQVFEGCK